MTETDEAYKPPRFDRRFWVRLLATTLIGVSAVVAALFVAMSVFTWMLGDLSWGDEAKRPLKYPRDAEKMAEIVDWVQANGNCRDMYVELPREYEAFTAGGLTSCWGETVFLAQWSGIPDDAGGYWYSPRESPEGWDMWGMICRDPVDLGDGWWRCGMGD